MYNAIMALVSLAIQELINIIIFETINSTLYPKIIYIYIYNINVALRKASVVLMSYMQLGALLIGRGGALDLSKAFDTMNHFALFIKLTNRNTPVNLLAVVELPTLSPALSGGIEYQLL